MIDNLKRPNVQTAAYVRQDGSLDHHAIRAVRRRDGRPDYRLRSRICAAHAIDCGGEASPDGRMANLWSAYWFNRWLDRHFEAKSTLSLIVEAASESIPPRLGDLEAVKVEKGEGK